jgi:plasma kallikrein
VPYYLCNSSTDQVITDASLLIDERFDIETPPAATTCPTMQKCCKRVDYVPPPTSKTNKLCLVERNPKCGVWSERGLGGSQDKKKYAQYAEFPWIVAVLQNSVRDGKGPIFIAGGSLIHPKVVLSAAHKFFGKDPKKLYVRAGEWNTKTTQEICPHQEIGVDHLIRHEDYKIENYRNNIAMLILTKEFKLTSVVGVVCLPPRNEDFKREKCFSGGWGQTEFDKKGIYQDYLKKIPLLVVDSDGCQETLRENPLIGADFVVSDDKLCAGETSSKHFKVN